MTAGRPIVVAERPVPGTPRPYDFPTTEGTTLANGLRVVWAHMPGRALVTASVVIRRGGVDEPAELAGATVLAARALTEGTETRTAIELNEAAERLGASLHAEASWDSLSAGVDVPAARLGQALELLAEVLRRPTFPAAEIDRLRDERLNDLLQARADPRRRAEEAFSAAVYDAASPYHRSLGGSEATVRGIDREAVEQVYRSVIVPSAATLVVAGDLDGIDVATVAGSLFGDLAGPSPATTPGPIVARAARNDRRITVVHRPGAVQTEIRIGHPGVGRRTPDFHALSVMGAILGGLFNSRLNTKLREEKGYTYGASAGFDLRRGPGPFGARAAVNTEATVPALVDTLAELDLIRDAPVAAAELAAGRDFLVGVFPLRFETPGPVAGALAGLFVHELPDDELRRYRPAIEAVTADDIARVAREHIRPHEAAIVLVGDHDAFGAALAEAGIAPITIERDGDPAAPGAAADGDGRGTDEADDGDA